MLLTDESGHALRTAAATDGSHPDSTPRGRAHSRRVPTSGLDPVIPAGLARALLPLTAGDAEIGALALCFKDERAFSTQDRDYLMAVGGVAGMALARRAGRR